jgi:hypothetical protein
MKTPLEFFRTRRTSSICARPHHRGRHLCIAEFRQSRAAQGASLGGYKPGATEHRRCVQQHGPGLGDKGVRGQRRDRHTASRCSEALRTERAHSPRTSPLPSRYSPRWRIIRSATSSSWRTRSALLAPSVQPAHGTSAASQPATRSAWVPDRGGRHFPTNPPLPFEEAGSPAQPRGRCPPGRVRPAKPIGVRNDPR